ncbi:putative receptor-like protein kinase At3g47110 [Pyrus x bretschneideri]|uniref:putative receptor-like protein kinase At3g47110 n=1 Tax=Pyrus x bretschneideri TaxID=225117 RepID=UPI00202FDF05|nr:putative receptor-like protein kinase At3g47110 [Pyrus x bretschneideri]
METKDFGVHTGGSVSGSFGDKMVLVGNKRRMQENNVEVGPEVDNALAIAHTNFSVDQSALLALKAHITSDPQNILTANWSSPSNSDICNWVGVTCGARHHRVMALNLSFMGLAGVIPPHLGNLSFLIELDLKNNSFHGPLPQELSRLRRLKKINFGNNNFMGTIPSWFGSFAKLESFKLHSYNFLHI